jgi:hypothetical protein
MYHDSFLGLWRQSLDEDQPQPIKGFDALRVFNFMPSFDGEEPGLHHRSGNSRNHPDRKLSVSETVELEVRL